MLDPKIRGTAQQGHDLQIHEPWEKPPFRSGTRTVIPQCFFQPILLTPCIRFSCLLGSWEFPSSFKDVDGCGHWVTLTEMSGMAEGGLMIVPRAGHKWLCMPLVAGRENTGDNCELFEDSKDTGYETFCLISKKNYLKSSKIQKGMDTRSLTYRHFLT